MNSCLSFVQSLQPELRRSTQELLPCQIGEMTYEELQQLQQLQRIGFLWEPPMSRAGFQTWSPPVPSPPAIKVQPDNRLRDLFTQEGCKDLELTFEEDSRTLKVRRCVMMGSPFFERILSST